jgi:hypothetical protein
VWSQKFRITAGSLSVAQAAKSLVRFLLLFGRIIGICVNDCWHKKRVAVCGPVCYLGICWSCTWTVALQVSCLWWLPMGGRASRAV